MLIKARHLELIRPLWKWSMILSVAPCKTSNSCYIRSVRPVSRPQVARVWDKVKLRFRAQSCRKSARTSLNLKPSFKTQQPRSAKKPALWKTTGLSSPTKPNPTTWMFSGMKHWQVCIRWWESSIRRSRRWCRRDRSSLCSLMSLMPFSICSYQDKTRHFIRQPLWFIHWTNWLWPTAKKASHSRIKSP